MSSSSAFTALPIAWYAIAAFFLSYVCLRVWRYSRARLSAKVSLPQPVSSAKESFSLAKSTSWNWSRWSLLWPRSWSKAKSKPAAILDTPSRDNSVELLPTTGLPPPPTPPPLVDLVTPVAPATSGAQTSTRTPSPTQHHKHVAHQLYSRPASPHAFLATTSPSKSHKRSRSLGGVPVRRLSSGTNSALRNAFPTPSTPPPDFDHEMREIASSSNSSFRDQILIDFSSSGSSEEGDMEARVSPAASDIGVLPSHVFTKPRPSPVPLVDFAQSDVTPGFRGRQPAMDDMDSWRWFKSPALASFGHHTQKVANFATSTATAIGVHSWASRSTSSLADIPQPSFSDNEAPSKHVAAPMPNVGAEKEPIAGSSKRLVDVDAVEVPRTAVPMPEPIPFKLPPPPERTSVRLVDVELPSDQASSRVPVVSRHAKNVSDVFHHPLEELVDVLPVPMAASKPVTPSATSTTFSNASLSMPNTPIPPFSLPAQQAVPPLSIAHSLSLPLDLGANPASSIALPEPVIAPSKVSIAIPTPVPVVREVVDTPTEPLIPVFVDDSQSSSIGASEPVEDNWSWGMDELNQDPWADHIEIPDMVDESQQDITLEREREHDALIDLEQEDAEREMELGMGLGSSQDDTTSAGTAQNLPFTNITNVTTFDDHYAPAHSIVIVSSEKDDEPSLVIGSTVDIALDGEKENQADQDVEPIHVKEEVGEGVEEVEEEKTPRATPAQQLIELPPAPLLSPTVTSFNHVAGLMELELSHQYNFADPPSPVILYDDDSIENLSLDSYFPDPELLPLPSPTKISRFEISMPTPPPSAQFGIPTFAQSASFSSDSDVAVTAADAVEDDEAQYITVKSFDEPSSGPSIPHIQTPTPPASPPPSTKAFGLALDTALMKESLLAPPISIAPIARGNKGKAGRSLPPSPRLTASKSLSPISNTAVAVHRVAAPMAISRARSEGANVVGAGKQESVSALWGTATGGVDSGVDGGVVDEGENEDGQSTPVANRPLWSIRAADAPVLGLKSVQSSPILARRALEKEVVEKVEEEEAEKVEEVKEHVEEKSAEVVPEVIVTAAPAIERTSSLPGAFPDSSSSTTLSSSTSTSSDVTLTPSDSTSASELDMDVKPANAVMKPRTTPSVRTIVRSPIEIALAMQLRPGLGVGADPAWMVRFLMSMFGWFAVLVSGQAEYY
ncbi:hypothetical protein CVT24_013058 [Panaeolus cyanescens]|uniref:Uncharacterized protein n=1 Tax=Panaeolus cyanescens TaxID=181874 RepID=A0A409YUQ1_9AGAR|nr:hypothetical protein CVT24_013058 [Panaeolus cyanescens]